MPQYVASATSGKIEAEFIGVKEGGLMRAWDETLM
jgi:hypothetical protein